MRIQLVLFIGDSGIDKVSELGKIMKNSVETFGTTLPETVGNNMR